ncbi:MAG: MTH1187 family thiamine-binding protein [Euryarchaeota archaeon]|nr:MTH1187 family thiamine-binding protein [Euryarchaeota archaeon]
MSVMVEFSMSPLDKGASVGDAVAKVVDFIDRSGVPYRLNPMGTVIEGTWDECFGLVKQCYALMAEESGRITITMKVDVRAGEDGRLDTKVRSVEERVGRKLRT